MMTSATKLYQHLSKSSKHKEKRHLNEFSVLQIALDKDKYKDELLQQIQEKRMRDKREKEKKFIEEVREEERVKREIQELNQQFKDTREQDLGLTPKKGEVFESTADPPEPAENKKSRTKIIKTTIKPRELKQKTVEVKEKSPVQDERPIKPIKDLKNVIREIKAQPIAAEDKPRPKVQRPKANNYSRYRPNNITSPPKAKATT